MSETNSDIVNDETHLDNGKSIRAITMGCRLNLYESEAMKKAAQSADADNIILINTCAVTSEAVRQAKQAIRRARRENPEAAIIVSGCAAQIEPETFAAMAEVDKIIGNHDKGKPETYKGLMARSERVIVNDIMSIKETANHLIDGLEGRTRAYIQVQNGCDHRCTFCVIPYGRGNSRSVAATEIIATINNLTENGVNEIVLSGVDMTSWGADLPGQPNLGNLIERIFKLCPDLTRLRLSSIDAVEIDETLFRLFAEEERLMPHLHLSLQHGNDMILKRMKRRHLRHHAIELAARLKRARPNIAFGADIIAGFPTESEEFFADSVSLIDEAELSFVHVFPYSPRPNTPAAKMPQLDRALIKDRAKRLRLKGDEALQKLLNSQIGTEQNILIENNNFGRLDNFARVRIDTNKYNATPSTIIKAKLIGIEKDFLLT